MTFCAALALSALSFAPAQADTFGSGANTFAIDFVTIGNPGNGDDASGPVYTADGGNYASPYGGVSYVYRIGVTEVPQGWVNKASNLGLEHANGGWWTGFQPAAMPWYQAAAFVNWLNTSTGHQAAYGLRWTGSAWTMNLWSSAQAWQLDGVNYFRHKDAYYFLPSEDEWYKAAYHKNDGVTANYWEYATGSNSIPAPVAAGANAETAVYGAPASSPSAVDHAGGASAYGTRGQNGNVWEWMEGLHEEMDEPWPEYTTSSRVWRGGAHFDSPDALRPYVRIAVIPERADQSGGFRVASIPEPSTALLLGGAGLGLLLRRRR